MHATADSTCATEIDQLKKLLAVVPLDRVALLATFRRIEQGLRDWSAELDQSGGLLDESDRAARPSLAREEDRLREEIDKLLREVEACRRETIGPGGDDELRLCASAVLAGLRGHHDAEASLVLESADTEVGAGD
ncbi:MAG TPA: hypothetical protein VKD71_03295 [Gemmataceae bacterium]|nr:hypothetical protein [Gemmataceae bacterium]